MVRVYSCAQGLQSCGGQVHGLSKGWWNRVCPSKGRRRHNDGAFPAQDLLSKVVVVVQER
jgi:hypothetical protein